MTCCGIGGLHLEPTKAADQPRSFRVVVIRATSAARWVSTFVMQRSLHGSRVLTARLGIPLGLTGDQETDGESPRPGHANRGS
jgi:hypothetical protein